MMESDENDEYAELGNTYQREKKKKLSVINNRKISQELDKSLNKLKASFMVFDKAKLSKLVIRFYSVLIAQHLFAFAFCIASLNTTMLQNFITQRNGLFMLSFTFSVSLSLSSFFWKKHLRKVPYNIILLSAFTLTYSYVLGTICLEVDYYLVLMAIFTTFVITVILILYVSMARHKYSIVGSGGAVVFTGIFHYCFLSLYSTIHKLMIIISVIWLFFWGIYLIFWTRKLKRKIYKLKANDYIVASFQFYIVILFIFSFVYGWKDYRHLIIKRQDTQSE